MKFGNNYLRIMDNQNDNELTIDESLELFERRIFSEILMARTYHEATSQASIDSIMYLAYGFAFVSVKTFWSACYCFKQAQRMVVLAIGFSILSKIKSEP